MYATRDDDFEVDPRTTPVRSRARRERGNRTNVRARAIRTSMSGR